MKIRIVQPVPVAARLGLTVGLELEATEKEDLPIVEAEDIGTKARLHYLHSRDGYWVRSPATNELVRLFKHEAEVVSP